MSNSNGRTGDEKGDSLSINLSLTSSPSTPRIPLVITPSKTTASELRGQASSATKIPSSSIKLIFRGRLIPDDSNLLVADEFKLEDGCVVHCMGKPVPTESGTQSSLSASAAADPVISTSAGPSVTVVPPAAGAPAAAAAAAAAAAGTATSSPSVLSLVLNTLRTSNSSETYRTALTTLEKIISNIIQNPHEEKYRRVKKSNAAFQRRLGGIPGGDAAMKCVGFALEENRNRGDDGDGDGEWYYVLHASADAWPKLIASKEVIQRALVEAKRVAASSAPPPPPPAAATSAAPQMNLPFGGGGAGGFGTSGMMGQNIPPGMESMVSNMMSDPNALQSMLQNPMVRQMMQNDPRFANNPQLRQQLDALSNDPSMIRRLSTMMNDPMMRSTVQQMMMAQQQGQNPLAGMMGGMGGAGAGGGFGASGSTGGSTPGPGTNFNVGSNTATTTTTPSTTGGGGGSSANAGRNNNSSNDNNSGEGSDREMTEEEMIAEAIARSLRES